MKMKLDPDIPLRAYSAFFNQTFVWQLTDEERHQLALALEAGDATAALALQQHSRSNSEAGALEIIDAFGKMIAGAHVPANTLGADEGVE